MSNKKLQYYIILVLFFIMPISSIGQICDLINSIIDFHWKKQYDYSLICKKPDVYYFYGDDCLPSVKNNLSSVFPQKITDSLISIMKNNTANINYDSCKNPKFKLISKVKAKRIYNKNQKKELEYFSNNSFVVFIVVSIYDLLYINFCY